jgi:hypothetical protein
MLEMRGARVRRFAWIARFSRTTKKDSESDFIKAPRVFVLVALKQCEVMKSADVVFLIPVLKPYGVTQPREKSSHFAAPAVTHYHQPT